MDGVVTFAPRQRPVRGVSDADRRNGRRSPARLCRSGERCTVRVHAFLRLPPPRWAFSSPGPCPHQGSFPRKSGCHDHIPPSLRTTCRTAAASPRTIPGHAGAQIDQAAGHAVIWGGTLGVRRDAQGACDGELSVPHWRRPVCAIDHTLKNEPTATVCAWFSPGLENPRVEQTSTASRRSLSPFPLFGASRCGSRSQTADRRFYESKESHCVLRPRARVTTFVERDTWVKESARCR